MKNSAAILILAAVVPLHSFGCELADLGKLAADETLHYEFIQTKTVAALSRPLQSNGVLGLSENQELVWQTLRPLKSTLVIDAEGVQQFNRNDQLVSEITNPVANELAQVFLNVLSGNTEALATVFTQNLTCEDSNWQLELVPADEDVKNLLSSLTLNGAEYIEKISFREIRGDYTEIVLSAPLAGPVANLATYLRD
jgi:hypothetical protein